MTTPESEAKSQWQAAWRRMPREERGGPHAVFAFIREYGEGLPDDWQGRSGDPWTTIHSWLREADETDGIEWERG